MTVLSSNDQVIGNRKPDLRFLAAWGRLGLKKG
jgi:hypothetical protein